MQKQQLRILDFLWRQGGIGATQKEIADAISLSRSYVRRLIRELICNGLVVQRQSTPMSKLSRYYAAYTNLGFNLDFSTSPPIYNLFSSWNFGSGKCFLCGQVLSGINSADEHIFPKWLQNRFQLWDKSLELLNGTTIPYRRLLIPCCKQCNSYFLSQVEDSIRKAHSSGFETFKALPRLMIFQWLSKIFFGLLFRELSLLNDRRDPSLGFVVSEEMIKRYRVLHYFLQSVRLPFVFRAFQPWSIFIFRLLPFNDERDFDYYDVLHTLTFGLRLGEIGVIASLQDVGLQEQLQAKLQVVLEPLRLHPIQFAEIMARVTYGNLQMTRDPKFMISEAPDPRHPTEVILSPLAGLSNKPVLREWESSEYAHVLHHYWSEYGITFEQTFTEPNLVRSMIFSEEGLLLELDTQGRVVSKLKPPV